MGCVLNQILSSSLGPFALCLRAALGLFVLCGEGESAHADHLSPKHDPWAQPWELERLALLKVPEDMVPVPGGPFLMGSDPQVDRAAGPQEQPQRPVLLDAFEIDRYEITNVHYLRFVLATGAAWPPFWMQDPFLEKMASHPVIGVSWEEANAYC